MIDDEGHNEGTSPDKSGGTQPSAEERRVAARRRFLSQGVAAGSGLVIYTIHHQRSFAGGGAKKVLASSPAACASLGGVAGRKPVKVVDSVNPVQKVDKNGNLVFKHGEPVYEKTKEAFECQIK